MLENLKLRASDPFNPQLLRWIRIYWCETPFFFRQLRRARDFLVPSRVNRVISMPFTKSSDYKTIVDECRFDRYYQIVKCFRDEDLRGDRQLYYQVDLETSFLSDQEIQDITEGLISRVMKETKGIEVTLPFPRMRL